MLKSLASPTEVRALMTPSLDMSSLAARGSRVPDRWSREPLSPRGGALPPSPRSSSSASAQGLTLVHFSAQLKRLLRNRGCIQGMCKGCLGGVRGY